MSDSSRIVTVIIRVMSQELGIPEAQLSAETKIPSSKEGFMVVARMANAIPGGGMLSISSPEMCTVQELAEKCVSEMKRNAALLAR